MTAVRRRPAGSAPNGAAGWLQAERPALRRIPGNDICARLIPMPMDSAVGMALSELGMRGAMSRLYAAMVLSSSNTDAIREGRVHGPAEDAGGNTTAVSCMTELSRWIGALETFTGQADLENEFLFPIRKSAESLQHMREDDRRSTDVEGLVFAVSGPQYDDAAGQDLKTVSALVPSLESAMCIRVKNWDEDNGTGWHVFGNVQPVPLVNRMHPTKKHRITPAESTNGLEGMGFLKCPLSDAGCFRKSVAMENFCEVYSRQKQKRHMLGAPLILHGRVTSIDPNRISLSGCGRSEAYLTAYLSEDACMTFAEKRTGELEGEYARVLVVAWYWSDYDGRREKPEYEAYIVEKTDLNGALTGDVEGLVRVLGPTAVEMIEDRYGYVPESPSLVREADRVSFRNRGGTEADHVQRQFLESTREIRNTRQAADGSIHCFPKITPGIRGPMPKAGDESAALQILLFIIKNEDCGVPVTRGRVRTRFHAGSLPGMRLLESRRHVTEREGGFAVATANGRRAGYEQTVEDLGRGLGPLMAPAVFLPDLETGQTPPSFVVTYLEKSGYRRIKVDGYACKIALYRDGAPERDVDACAAKVREWAEKILDEFGSVSHPLTPAYLAPRMPEAASAVPAIYVEKVLNMMENDGRVRRDGGGSWSVSMKDRIRRVFSKHPKEILSKEQVMRRATVAGRDVDAVEEILHQLLNDGLLSEIPGGKWATPETADAKRAEELYERAEHLVRVRLGRRAMDEQVFLGYVARLLGELGAGYGLLEAARDVADRLVADGVVEKHDGMYRSGRLRPQSGYMAKTLGEKRDGTYRPGHGPTSH